MGRVREGAIRPASDNPGDFPGKKEGRENRVGHERKGREEGGWKFPGQFVAPRKIIIGPFLFSNTFGRIVVLP